MPYLIGVALSLGVAVLGRRAGFDRDRAFYAAVGIPDIVGFEPEVTGRPEAEVRLARLARVGIPATLGPGPWIPVPAEAEAAADRWRAACGPTDRAALVTIAPAARASVATLPGLRNT